MKIQAVFRVGDDEPRSVWHPTLDGAHEMLWCWDGSQWIDPIAEIESQITELVIPHLEDMFAQGFAAGLAAAQC